VRERLRDERGERRRRRRGRGRERREHVVEAEGGAGPARSLERQAGGVRVGRASPVLDGDLNPVQVSLAQTGEGACALGGEEGEAPQECEQGWWIGSVG